MAALTDAARGGGAPRCLWAALTKAGWGGYPGALQPKEMYSIYGSKGTLHVNVANQTLFLVHNVRGGEPAPPPMLLLVIVFHYINFDVVMLRHPHVRARHRCKLVLECYVLILHHPCARACHRILRTC